MAVFTGTTIEEAKDFDYKNDEKGKAPRALYKKFGFKEGEKTIEFGYPNQVFVLEPAIYE